MEKFKFETPDLTKQNIEKIERIFPNCITEDIDENGNPKKAINFDILKQMLSDEIVEGDEAYEFSWVGKKSAMLSANKPIRKTLRPCKEESVDWENTENLYIEGDNLEVLKLLQESYLGSVKMIYIDPPYNTGNDSFTYPDDFSIDNDEYLEMSGQVDENGLRRFRENSESNPRFHSDWCSMMYSRLLLARNLLSDDGVICISIDDNEITNIDKLCCEIFGASNRVGEMIRKTKSMTGDNGNGFNLQHESLLIYAKKISSVHLIGEEKSFDNYSNPDNDPNGDWCSGDPSARSGGASTYFEIENPYTKHIDLPPNGRFWAFSKQTLQRYVSEGKIKFKKSHSATERGFIFKRYKKDLNSIFEPVHSLVATENSYMNQNATVELRNLFSMSVYDYPKPVAYMNKITNYCSNPDSIILDFFSGSATTAHAVMKLNAEDGGNRKFIMVQLQEPCKEDSEAFKAGYKNICEIGKERIRRAAKKIKEENPNAKFDGGFRVFKVADSNMNDVFYSAGEYSQGLLTKAEDNIKSDRTDMDLLYGCLLDWGVPISVHHKEEIVNGFKIHIYGNGEIIDLIACFEENISEALIKEIARKQPLKAVFRDSCFANSPSKINAEEIFKLISPDTRIKVI